MKAPDNLEQYADKYDEAQLWTKVKKVARKVGVKLIYLVLVLFYALKSAELTAKDKALIIGALGYFILPLDIIPDFIPGFGYTDDWAALLLVFYKISSSVTPEVKAMAKCRIYDWFGDIDDSDMEIDSRPDGHSDSIDEQ